MRYKKNNKTIRHFSQITDDSKNESDVPQRENLSDILQCEDVSDLGFMDSEDDLESIAEENLFEVVGLHPSPKKNKRSSSEPLEPSTSNIDIYAPSTSGTEHPKRQKFNE